MRARLSALAQEGGPGRKVIEVDLLAPAEGVYSDVIHIEGRASSAAGVKRIELFVDNYVVSTFEPEDYRQDVDLAFDWDSRFVPELKERWPNGRWALGIRAVANGEREVDEESVTVAVDNAPETPAAPEAELDGASVSMRWAPNPEPDIRHYLIQRDSGGGYEVIAKSRNPAFYEIADAGTHLYRVFAIRRSPAVRGGRVSAPSHPVEVTVAASAASSGIGAGGRDGAAGGLPGASGLPGFDFGSGLPPLPGADPSTSDRWGRFDEKLPYGKAAVPKEFRLTGKETDGERDRWWNVIPPDGLRWVAAGALLLVMAMQARLFARRLLPDQETT